MNKYPVRKVSILVTTNAIYLDIETSQTFRKKEEKQSDNPLSANVTQQYRTVDRRYNLC